MPRIKVEWLSTRTDEQRQTLVDTITKAFVDVVGVKPDQVNIVSGASQFFQTIHSDILKLSANLPGRIQGKVPFSQIKGANNLRSRIPSRISSMACGPRHVHMETA